MDFAVLEGFKSGFVFAAVLSVLIVVHEWGHYITAKKLGVKVERFSIGFGPKLFSRFHDGTEFLISLIPLGGYVKMAGDERAACKGTAEEFFSKSPGHRALIVMNGPLVNYVMAYVCLVFVFMLGFPDLGTKVGKLMDDYPAQAAGLQTGDQILTINASEVETWTDIQQSIVTNGGKPLTLTVLRDGAEMKLQIAPKVQSRKNIFGQMKETPLIGISPDEAIEVYRYGFGESLTLAWDKLVEITVLTYKSLYFMITGSMSPKESMTGPIGIFYIVKAAADMGFSHLLYIFAVISASLAIFNLLPVIPLDGGHMFLLAIEKARGRALSAKADDLIARVGFSLIICLALFVFYTDFARFGWLDKIAEFFGK